MASLSKATMKQYGSALRQWSRFCIEVNTDFYKPEQERLLQFLTQKFKEGASYGTLNTYRSAISLISENKIGETPIITRFLKGAFRMRPSRPKYSQTWDVALVLKHIEKWFPLDKLSLSDLTKKTVMLLALCTAHRAQTLANIRIKNIISRDNGVEIRILDLIKTSGPGREQPLLVLPRFLEKPQLCVASTVIQYLKVTEKIREGKEKLFLAVKRPYSEVGSQTISRWVKSVLTESGIDTTVFTAHSTRHAATSTAFLKGVDLNIIRKTAGWSNSSQMFAKTYNRPVVKDNQVFARSVLQD